MLAFAQRFLVILALCLLTATPAHAKRGLMLINTGDELFEVADFPAEVVAANPGAKNAKVGYKCSHFGIFWADVWTWDCSLVAVTGENSYADLPPSIAGKLSGDPQYAMSHARRGFWNHYAFWTLIVAVAAFLLYGVFARKKESATDTDSDTHAAA